MSPLAVKALAVLTLAAVLIGGVESYGLIRYQRGYDVARAEAAAAYVTASERALAKERELNAAMTGATEKRLTENADHEKTIAALRAAGAVRLSIPVAARCAPPTNPAVAGGSGDQTRADVLPSVTNAVLGIAADSARGVRDFNALVDTYNAARLTCNQ